MPSSRVPLYWVVISAPSPPPCRRPGGGLRSAVGRSWGGTCAVCGKPRFCQQARRLSPSRRTRALPGGPRHGHHARAFPPGRLPRSAMSRASRLDTYLRDHTRTYPHAKTVAYRPQHPRRLRFHLAPQRLQPGRRCAEACGGRAATGRTEHGCTEHPAMPQRPVRGDRPGRQAARAVRQRLRQYRRQRLPGHPDGGARGALEPDPGEGRQGVARRYRRSPVAAHPDLYGFVRDGKYGVVDGQARSPGAAFRRHLPQQCQRIHHLRDRWQARHP